MFQTLKAPLEIPCQKKKKKKKNENLFAGTGTFSFFHRFLNAQLSNKFSFTWTFFEKHIIIYYSIFPCYNSTAKI